MPEPSCICQLLDKTTCSFVKDAFCLKLSSHLAGDEVHAFLVLKDSISLSEAKKSIASVLLATEQPKYWHTIDAIPLMDSSKVDVQHLKKLCQKNSLISSCVEHLDFCGLFLI